MDTSNGIQRWLGRSCNKHTCDGWEVETASVIHLFYSIHRSDSPRGPIVRLFRYNGSENFLEYQGDFVKCVLLRNHTAHYLGAKQFAPPRSVRVMRTISIGMLYQFNQDLRCSRFPD
eukprot:352098-Prorocentrum_minimum.AAC.3